MPEDSAECPICGRELENVGTGLMCEEHGEFNYNFRCPLCGSRVLNLVSTPTVCKCPNATCENNTALFTAVNNPGLDFARRQFLKGGGKGKDRKIAREILRGEVKKTHTGKEIGNFGGAGTKRYFDDHDIDRIFGVWDQYARNLNPTGIDKGIKGAKRGMAVHIPELGRADTSEVDALRAKASEMKDKGRFSRFIPRSRGRRPLPAVMKKDTHDAGTGGEVYRGEPGRGRGDGMTGQMGMPPACPECSRLGRAYQWRQVGQNVLYCEACHNAFIIDGAGNIKMLSEVQIPELCPVCNSILTKVEDGVRKVTILMCTNDSCMGPGFQPWFREMTQGEYRQFMKARAARYKPKLDVLKTAAGYNQSPGALDSKGLTTKAEIERMEENVKNGGVTDINYFRLPKLLESLPAAEKAGWYDEYMKIMKRYGKIPENEKKKAWFKNFKSFKERFENQYGFHDEAYKRFEDDRDFKKEFDEMDETSAAKRSYQRRETDNLMQKGIKLGRRRDGTDRRLGLDVFGNVRRNTTKTATAGIGELIGIIIGALYGWPFLMAATCFAARHILPDGKGYEMQKDFEGYKLGSLWATRQNRYSTGLGATKSLLKVSGLFFMGLGMFATELPFRGLMLIVFFFWAYFSLPAEYNPSTEPYKFIEGLGKPIIAVILSFYVFGGVFASKELQWMCLAFFAIFPIATEKENVARAIGSAGSGVSAVYENLDKVIFIVLMIIGYIAVMGGTGINLEFLVGTEATVFFFFWIIAGLGGVMSPASSRPYTGVIMLIMIFVFYSTGAGEQIVGQGFFGAWWPSIHNTVTSVTTPFAEAFGTLGETFGSTFMLLTNPVGYAKNIMDGSYEENPTGQTGSYGVEINSLIVPDVRPGTLSMVTFTVKNMGPARAGNVVVSFGMPNRLSLGGAIAVGHGEGIESEAARDGRVYDSRDIEEFGSLSPEYAVPLLYMIDASECDKINFVEEEGDLTGSHLTKRNEYIRLNVSVEYDYEVSSWIPVEIISNQEWQDRTAKGTFAPATIGSHVSTSPAKLSIGTFEQPIIAGKRPFYLGLNMTSEEGPDSEILWEQDPITKKERTEIKLEIPTDIADKIKCKPFVEGKPVAATDTKVFTWPGSMIKGNAIYCTSTSTEDMLQPSKTFFARASATFRFRKTVFKDTKFSFGDVCIDMTDVTPAACNTLGQTDCAQRTDCTWGTLPGASGATCNPVTTTSGV